MRVAEIMTPDVEFAAPEDTIQEAAAMMDELNVGALPVCNGNRLCGILTDRDITVRATASGYSASECKVGDVMTDEIAYCFEDDDVEQAAKKMKARQVRRLVVINRGKELVGVVSLGDLATKVAGSETATDTLRRVSSPAEPDRMG